jgi:repressor of nif and glnA expression
MTYDRGPMQIMRLLYRHRDGLGVRRICVGLRASGFHMAEGSVAATLCYMVAARKLVKVRACCETCLSNKTHYKLTPLGRSEVAFRLGDVDVIAHTQELVDS